MKQLVILATTAVALLVATQASVAQSRGTLREKEPCETLALEIATNPRASGSGVSTSEAIAFNIAKLQARNELAAQLAAEITSVLRHRAEQWQMTAGAGTTFNVKQPNFRGNVTGNANSPHTLSAALQHDSIEIAQLVSQILTNTRPICQNTYDRPDGSVQVYVCLEMDLSAQRKSYQELNEAGVLEMDFDGDGQNEVDLEEKEYLIELAKAREEYNAELRKANADIADQRQRNKDNL
jgi:hypothetical protein